MYLWRGEGKGEKDRFEKNERSKLKIGLKKLILQLTRKVILLC